MAKYLRIIFTILCAVCIAALIPLGLFFGWQGVGYCFFGAVAFFVLMLLCKQTQEIQELKQKNAQGDLSSLDQAQTNNTEQEKNEDTKS